MTDPAYSTVECYEENETGVENCDLHSGINCSVTLRCAYSNRWSLMDDILSNARPYPKATGLAPIPVSCSCKPVTIDKATTVGQLLGYVDALVTVNYSTSVVDVAAESLEPATEYVQLDPRRFRWEAGTGEYAKPLLDGEAPVFVKRRMNLIRTRYRLATIPAQVLTCLEGVNSAAYSSDILGLTFDAETLMFQPGGTNRSFTTLSTTGWTLTAKFVFNPDGWNTFWRAETQQFEPVYIAGSSSRYLQHPLVDYSELLG